jgi:hypothetical protein
VKKIVIAAIVFGSMAACQPANITAVMRPSDKENPSMETRCESIDMRDTPDMKELFGLFRLRSGLTPA